MSPPQDGLGALFPDSVCWFPFALFAFSCGLTVLKTSVALLFFSPSLWTAGLQSSVTFHLGVLDV